MIRRTTKFFLEFLAGLVAGAVILVVAGAWWLWSGPIPLTFLTPYIERALSPADSTIAVEIDETELQWAGWNRAANLQVSNVRVLDLERRVIAELPQVSLGLSLRAVLRGRVSPTYIEIIRPSVSVVRNADGGFAIGFAKEGSPVDAAQPEPESFVLERLIAELLSEPDRTRPLGYLARVGIVEGDLFIDDRRHERVWHAPRANIDFLRNANGIVANADADLEIDGAQSRVTGNAVYETESGTVDISFGFVNLDSGLFLRDLQQAAAIRLAELNLQVEGTVGLRMMSDGAIRSVRFDVETGSGSAKGEVSIGEDGYGISAATQLRDVRWPLLAALSPKLAEHAQIDVPIGGALTLAGTTDGGVMSLEFELEGGAGTLRLPELYADPIPVEALRLAGQATDDFRQIRIAEAGVVLQRGEVTSRAALTRIGTDLNLRLDGRVRGFDMNGLRRYWPAGVAADAYDWVTENIRKAIIDEASMSLVARFPNGDASKAQIGSLNGTINAREAEVHYFKPLPPVTGVAADMTFTDKRFDVAIGDGQLGDLVVDEGSAVITGLEADDQDIYIDLVLRGPISTALEVLDREPLGFISKLGIDAAAISGETAARLVFNFPLLKDLKIEQVAVAVGASLRAVALSNGPFGLAIGDGALKLQLTGAGMTVSGDATLNGVPLDISWEENFSDTSSFDRRFALRGVVDADARRRLKIDDLPFIGGAITGELTHTEFPDGRSESVARLDLNETVFDLPRLRFRKPTGAPGTLYAFLRTPATGPPVVEDLRLDAGDFRAEMRIVATPDLKGFETLEIRRLAFSGNDLRGRVRAADDGGFEIDLTGTQIDLGPLFDDGDDVDASVAEDVRPLRVRASFARALLGEGRALSDVKAELVSDGRNFRRVAVDAGVDGGVRLAVNLTPNGDGATLRIATRDAGRAIQAANWPNRLKGGSLLITGQQSAAGGPFTGAFELKRFKVTEAPVLARVLQVLSLTGIFSALGQDGLDFVALDGKFRYYGGALEIKNARAVGSSLGITAEGSVYVEDATADLSGTVVPAYTINNVLGNIPLLGPILTGGANEGIFAANYVVKGRLEDPRISVNPLSALAPGFLRNLIGGDVKPLTGEDAKSQSQ